MDGEEVGDGKREGAGRSFGGGEVCVRGILEQGWRRFGRDGAGGAKGPSSGERAKERGKGKGQQPVLDDHSTHYFTDAAADPVGKEDPFSFTHRHPPGPALLRVLAPHLPAISGGQGRMCYVETN